MENLPQDRQEEVRKEFTAVMADTRIRLQEIRDGGRTLRRTVHGVSRSGHEGFIERGYVRHAGGWSLVTKTKPSTWWKLFRPARSGEVEDILKNLPSGRAEER